MTQRKNLQLDDDAAATLDDIATAGGAQGDYVSNLIREANMRWRTAYRVAMAAEIMGAALLAACDALNGHNDLALYGELPSLETPGAIAMELRDAPPMDEKWELQPGEWRRLIELVRGNAGIADAVSTIAAEFWRGNSSLEARLRGREDD